MDIKPDNHLNSLEAQLTEFQIIRRECAQAREAFAKSVKAYKEYLQECREYLQTANAPTYTRKRPD